jgi:tRNA-dihydrouridine synthase
MVGRGAYGAPWMPGRIAQFLSDGKDPGAPCLDEQREIAIEHVEAMLVHYGRELGLRNARKHVGWYLASSGVAEGTIKTWRAKLCTSLEPKQVLSGLKAFYSGAELVAA